MFLYGSNWLESFLSSLTGRTPGAPLPVTTSITCITWIITDSLWNVQTWLLTSTEATSAPSLPSLWSLIKFWAETEIGLRWIFLHIWYEWKGCSLNILKVFAKRSCSKDEIILEQLCLVSLWSEVDQGNGDVGLFEEFNYLRPLLLQNIRNTSHLTTEAPTVIYL